MHHIKGITVLRAQQTPEDELYRWMQFIFDFVLTLVETKQKQGYPDW